MAIKAYLYDADGCDREVPLDADVLAGLDDRSLLWIDADDRDDPALACILGLVGVSPSSIRGNDGARPSLDNYGDHFHFRVNAAPQHDETLAEGEQPGAELEADRRHRALGTPGIDF